MGVLIQQVLRFKPFCNLQKFSSGLGSLPQLETPVVQVVVSNAKNQQQQSDNILPQITNKGGQNNYQTVRHSSMRHMCSC